MRRLTNQTAVVVLAVLCFNSQIATSNAAERVRPSAYISGDFCAVLVIHPQRIAKSPLAKPLPLDGVAGAAESQAPADVDVAALFETLKPEKILRIIVVVDPVPGGNLAFLPGVIVQYTEDIDGAAVLKALLEDAAIAKHNGKTYHRGAETDFLAKLPLCGHVADDRTLVFAAEPTMKKMLSAKKTDNPLLDRMKKTTLNHDVIVEFVAAPMVKAFEKKTGKTVAEALEDDPEDPIGQIATMVAGVSLTLDLSGDTLLKVNVTAASDAAAVQMEVMAKLGLKEAEKQFEALKPMIAENAPPNLTEPINALVKQVLSGLTISRSERDINAVLLMPAALLDLARNAGKVLDELDSDGP